MFRKTYLENLLTIGMDLVVNAIFVIAKTKYLITFISTDLIQYDCIYITLLFVLLLDMNSLI